MAADLWLHFSLPLLFLSLFRDRQARLLTTWYRSMGHGVRRRASPSRVLQIYGRLPGGR